MNGNVIQTKTKQTNILKMFDSGYLLVSIRLGSFDYRKAIDEPMKDETCL